MSANESLADQLRTIADTLDLRHAEPVGPDINLAQACKRLSSVIKTGKLEIVIAWDDWGKRAYRVEYEVKRDYSPIADGNNLSEVINKAIVKHQPSDTLDKISEMAGVVADKEDCIN